MIKERESQESKNSVAQSPNFPSSNNTIKKLSSNSTSLKKTIKRVSKLSFISDTNNSRNGSGRTIR